MRWLWLWLCVVAWVLVACAKAEPDSPPPAVHREALTVDPEVGTALGPLARAPMTQRSPRLVATNAGALAVWVDQRDLGPQEQAIYAARIFPDGGVGDPAGFRIATSTWVRSVAVASDGARVLVVWSEEVGSNAELFGVIIDATTGAAQGAVRSYSPSPLDDVAPMATFDGTDFILGWVRDTNPAQALVQRIDPTTGNSRNPAGVVFGAPTLGVDRVSVASIRGGHSALFIDQQLDDGGSSGAVYFMIDGGLPTLGATIAGPSTRSGSIGPATGSSYFVAWRDTTNGFPELLGARVDVTGLVLDVPPLDVARGSDGGIERALGEVVIAGPSVTVAWGEYTGGGSAVMLKRFDPMTGGGVPTVGVSATGREFDSPTIAALDTSVVLAWGERTAPGDGSNDDVFFTTTPTLGTGRLLSASAPTQARAVGTASDRRALVAWTAYNRADTEIELALWDSDLGTWSAVSAVNSPSFTQNNAALTADRQGAALATFERGATERIEAARVSGATLVDTSPLTVCTAAMSQRAPVAAFDGTQYWTGWLDDRAARAAYANRVTLAGQVLDGQGVKLPLDDPRSLAATSGPGEVLFASHDGLGRLQLARVWADGGIDPNLPTISAQFYARPSVAFDGLYYLAVWESDLPDGGEAVVASRFNVLGLHRLDDPPVQVHAAPDVDTISVGFDGVNFLVGWSEQIAPWVVNTLVKRIDSDGRVLDSTPTLITPPGRIWRPQLSGQGAGRSFVTFSRFDESSTAQTYRARVVRLEETAGGDPCQRTVDCPGTALQCVDGVCCNSSCGGGVTTDCIACSVDAGGQKDGVCTLRVPQPCRPASSECDVAELCDGQDLECPPDLTRSGLTCSAGVCVGTTCEVDDGGLVFPDAGVDAGSEDAGLDAGLPPPDGGASPDAGAGAANLTVGCACRAVEAPQLLVIAIAFRAILNRRRATARHR